jgi:hypothetical protein
VALLEQAKYYLFSKQGISLFIDFKAAALFIYLFVWCSKKQLNTEKHRLKGYKKNTKETSFQT